MSSTKNIPILIITGICLSALFSLAAKEPDWAGAKQEFNDNSKSNADKKRAACTARLAESISHKTEVEAAKLLIEQLTAEIARSNEGKAEERVSIDVIDACVNGLRKLTTDKAIDILLKKAGDAKSNWRTRFYAVRALGGINNPAATQALTGLLSDKEPALQMSALESLTKLNWPEGIQPACNLLTTDSAWEVKLAAIEYLRKIKSPDSVKPMQQAILRNKNIEALVLSQMLELIKELTKDAPAEAQSQENSNQTQSVINLGEYYKIKINSDRIIFVIDVSGSMAWESNEPPEDNTTAKESETEKAKPVTTGQEKPNAAGPSTEPSVAPIPEALQNKKKEVDSRIPKTRSAAVKKESIKTIYNLDPRVHFSIIFYSGGVEVWKNELVPATNENKLEAINAVDAKGPGGGTNMSDALEAAYKMVKSAGNTPDKGKDEPKKVATGDKKPHVTVDKVISGADTIFLLTDGQPTVGKIQAPDDIINHVRKLHDLRHIKINTIAVGAADPAAENTGVQTLVNIYLMRRLAEVTGGTFRNKTYKASDKDKNAK
ncbi:MAG: HEAT repeat domain-containing protein [Candidatus Brocadiia bacterium]